MEWAEKFPEDMPYDYLEITITADGDGARRIVAHSLGSLAPASVRVWANDSKSRPWESASCRDENASGTVLSASVLLGSLSCGARAVGYNRPH